MSGIITIKGSLKAEVITRVWKLMETSDHFIIEVSKDNSRILDSTWTTVSREIGAE